MKDTYKTLTSILLLRKDRRWFLKSGADVTPFLWGTTKTFFSWPDEMPESLLRLLLPNKYRKKEMFKTEGPQGPNWRIFSDNQTRARYIVRANNYRLKMVGKLYNYAKAGDEAKFESLSKTLVLHSKAFRV